MHKQQDSYQLKNGMVLLGESMEHVHSVSFQFLLPGGACLLPKGCCGAATVIGDWLFRGAGSRSSRELIQELDHLGIHRSGSASAHHLSLNASLEAGNLQPALDLYADILLRPHLSADQFTSSRQLAVSDLLGLDDDPRQKVMVLLYEQFYPDPFGRPAIGKLDQLQSLTPSATAEIAKQLYDPNQIIFSICGKYDFTAVCKQMEKLFDSPGVQGLAPEPSCPTKAHYKHYAGEGAQVHIGLMTAAPTLASEHYYDVAVAVSVLSGSMSSRLFTEVREKRGLCYAVGARYKMLKDYAGISCYAGTTPDKAQQTLDVVMEQFDMLKDGISDDEIQRARVGLKTSLIMQAELTSARCSGIAADYFMIGRIRELDEIREKIEGITADSVLHFLRSRPFDDFFAVTLGPAQIRFKGRAS